MSHRAREYSGWSIAIVVVIVSLVPVVWILMLSLKTSASATDGSFIPHHWTLSNYSDIFKLGTFTSALRNSIGIALISTAPGRGARLVGRATRSPASTSPARR